MSRLVLQRPDGATRLEDGKDELRKNAEANGARLVYEAHCAVCGAASDSLDAAWAEAEAALPEGWRIAELSRGVADVNDPKQRHHGYWWNAYATPEADTVIPGMEELVDDDGAVWNEGHGPTPAAALRDLAAKLLER